MNINVDFDEGTLAQALLDILIEERDSPDELIEKLTKYVDSGKDSSATKWAIEVLVDAAKNGIDIN